MSANYLISNSDEEFSVMHEGEVQCIAFRKKENRAIWLVCLYGDFDRMLPPGGSGVVRAVVDDFGRLVRVQ